MYMILDHTGANTAYLGGGGGAFRASIGGGGISRHASFGDEWGASIGGSGSPIIHAPQFSEQG